MVPVTRPFRHVALTLAGSSSIDGWSRRSEMLTSSSDMNPHSRQSAPDLDTTVPGACLI